VSSAIESAFPSVSSNVYATVPAGSTVAVTVNSVSVAVSATAVALPDPMAPFIVTAPVHPVIAASGTIYAVVRESVTC